MNKNVLKRFFIISLVFSLLFSNIYISPNYVFADNIEESSENLEDLESINDEEENDSNDEDNEDNEDVDDVSDDDKNEEKESTPTEVPTEDINVHFIIDGELYKEVNVEDVKVTSLEDGFVIDYVEPTDKKGYKFIGWSYNEDSFDEFSFKVYDSETLYVYAIYERMTATVSFKNTPVDIEPIEVDLSSENLTISEPDDRYTYKNYYNFLGFTTTETYNKNSIFDFNTPITEDIVLYAQYSPVSFSILYKITINGEEKNIKLFSELKNPNRTSYTVETGKFKLEEPSMKGYIFLGWTGTDLKRNTKDVTVSFDSRGAITYTMNFISGEGLYSDEFKKTMSFDELLDKEILVLSDNGVLSTGGIKKIERVNDAGTVVTDDFGEAIIDKVENSSNKDLEGILILPEEGLTKIDEDAFSLLSNMSQIFIPDTVTEIGDRAFKNSSFSKITFMDNGLESIGDEAFSGCSNLTELILPDTVESIGDNLLEDVNIDEIYIPSSLNEFNTDILPSSLVNIYVGKENKNYADIKGVLVSKDEKTLIKYPAGRVDNEYQVPSDIETIAENAFKETRLEKIDLGSVSTIEDYAFVDSSNLRVVLNDNLENISDNSFEEIREIYYSGENEDFLNKSFGAKRVGENHKIIYNLGNSDKVTNNNKTYFHEFEEFYLKEPSRDGYTFIGWVYDNFTNPIKNFHVDKFNDQDITLRAVWSTKGSTYTVVFDRNFDGEYNKETQEFIYLDDNNATTFNLYKNNYVRNGYSFKGWSLEKDGAVDFKDEERILTNLAGRNQTCVLYAVWELNTYSIVYGPEENNDNPVTYSVLDEVKLEAPVKYGYKFIGWIGSCGQVPKKNVVIRKGSVGDRIYIPIYKKA